MHAAAFAGPVQPGQNNVEGKKLIDVVMTPDGRTGMAVPSVDTADTS
jgi:hypothetical protein